MRRLVALCHVVNRLVDLAETETSNGPASRMLVEHAHMTRDILSDVVLDLVVGEKAYQVPATGR